ncbi:MAG: hypothetical protein LUQ38_11595 [Methanotrichaceae archaeon]|nr:hypothetical protein [Methanotrichaceae archaeon]MDD1758312.1 hypothetical protein [Methanotrichaceae archaeon]
MFDVNAVVFAPAGDLIRGKKAIEAFWKSVMEYGVKKADLTTQELNGSDDFVQEMGTGVLTVRPANQNIKYLMVWKYPPSLSSIALIS